ncbi:uncharacterized protein Tco025E_08482 [Trypanosoma conorhini]|uniref:Uncharacterized protein n=1 Tax=Trypanosoma conorhini TaxID=83891 RepID=A0A3R7KV29_9TRYP|nr:uncharacterized protein Tco025E_08482 [Trypanosoma conorhini]RNF01957.1 hypothetical protein Tco025E_08482 [Trypanosoma conorhini]
MGQAHAQEPGRAPGVGGARAHSDASGSGTPPLQTGQLHPHRLPSVEALEMEIPVVLSNFPRVRQRGGGGSVSGPSRRETIERGNPVGVPFDQWSLSTIGGDSAATTHRRRKKYTTTTVTTTTVTKILLPHMQQVVAFPDADGAVNHNAGDSQAVAVAIEGGSRALRENSGELNRVDGAAVLRGPGHSIEKRQLSPKEGTPASRPLQPARRNRSSRGQPNENGANSTNNGKGVLPDIASLKVYRLESEEPTPREDAAARQPPDEGSYAMAPQQPWLYSQQTFGKTAVTHHGSSLPRLPDAGNQRGPSPGSLPGASADYKGHNEGGSLVGPQSVATPPNPRQLQPIAYHAHHRGIQLSHEAEAPWILSEERQENGWRATE